MNIWSHGNTLPLNSISPHVPANASWRDYPAGIGGHNAITTDAKSLSDRLSRLSEILFSDEVDLRIVDVRSDNGKGTLRRECEEPMEPPVR